MKPTIYIGNFLTESHQRIINNYIANFKQKNDGFQVEVTPLKDKRSLNQNRYYWGVLVKALMITNAETGRSESGKRYCDYEFKLAYQKAYRTDDLPEHKDFDVGKMMGYLDFCFIYLTDPEYDINASITMQEFNELDELKKLCEVDTDVKV